jgi:hypothetical protein
MSIWTPPWMRALLSAIMQLICGIVPPTVVRSGQNNLQKTWCSICGNIYGKLAMSWDLSAVPEEVPVLMFMSISSPFATRHSDPT